MGTRSKHQVCSQGSIIKKKLVKNSKPEDKDLLDILLRPIVRQVILLLTESEHLLFLEAVRQYGKNWDKIIAYIGGNISRCKLYNHAKRFINQVEKDSTLPNADILPILKQRAIRKKNPWTDVEHQSFLEAVRVHGKDWDKIMEVIETRKRSSIINYAK